MLSDIEAMEMASIIELWLKDCMLVFSFRTKALKLPHKHIVLKLVLKRRKLASQPL